MKITDIKIGTLKTPLKTPFKTAVRCVDEMVEVIVKIETDAEVSGWGAAPPTAKVTGDTVGSIVGAIGDTIRPQLLGANAEDLEDCLARLNDSITRNTSPKAAVDIALHDLWARSIGRPVWQLFGGSGKQIKTDVTVSVDTPEKMTADAIAAKESGFDTIKIKLGIDSEVDLLRLRTIRSAVGDGMKVRIDANQGWTPKEAVHLLEHIESEGFNIDIVEQPVKAYDLKGMAFVTQRSPFPVVADESCWSPSDAIRILESGAADMVNIKLMKCGGIKAARQIVAIADAMGAKAMMGVMLEGRISSAAAVHLASAYDTITRADIDGPLLSKTDPTKGGPQYDGAVITPNATPGFGVESVSGIEWL